MTINDLVLALSDHGISVSLSQSGTLRCRGETLPPALLAEVRAHKAELVTALQEARALASDLYRAGEVEAFTAELSAACLRGALSITDRWAAGLAIVLAGRWQATGQEDAA